MHAPPLVLLGQIEGDAHQLREVERGKLLLPPSRLSHVEIDLAKAAAGHQAVRPRFDRPSHDVVGDLGRDLPVGHRQIGSAAVGLVRPVDRFGTKSGYQLIKEDGILVIAHLDDVRMANECTTVVRRDLQGFERLPVQIRQPIQQLRFEEDFVH